VTLLDIAGAMVIAGACDNHEPCDWWGLDAGASWIADACDATDAPLAEPTGAECAALVVAIWSVETAGTFVPYSTGRWTGSGVGPIGIVQPRNCFRNAAIVVHCFGPEELFGGASNIRVAVEILRWKWAKHRTLKSRLEAFNGSAAKGRYADRVLGLMGRM